VLGEAKRGDDGHATADWVRDQRRHALILAFPMNWRLFIESSRLRSPIANSVSGTNFGSLAIISIAAQAILERSRKDGLRAGRAPRKASARHAERDGRGRSKGRWARRAAYGEGFAWPVLVQVAGAV
jgi:hypothetical protein